MTDERAIIKLVLKTGAGGSHGKSPFMTLDRLATASERTSSVLYLVE